VRVGAGGVAIGAHPGHDPGASQRALVLLPPFAGGLRSRRDATGWVVPAAGRSTFRVERGGPPERTLAPSLVFILAPVALFVLGRAKG
jgi:hypothetical protein